MNTILDAAVDGAAALSFSAVFKRYGLQTVLDGFDLEVRRGESFALVGANGAGKSTCIRALLDLCDIDRGDIRIFGVPASRPRARAPLAYLPERFLPPYYLRGGDFIDYMSRLYAVRPSSADIEQALAVLDLDREALRRPVRDFSKGMAQKLGLVACFLSQRALAVLDEPMSGLDPKARLLVKRRLEDWRAGGRTLFFSTHLLADVEEMCDRLGVLHEGRLRFVGAPGALREQYRAATLEEAYLGCIS